MRFDKVIRGVEVVVVAEEFDGDDSVGMAVAPEVVYAETLDGEPFELTSEEVDTLTVEASQMYYENDSYLDFE